LLQALTSVVAAPGCTIELTVVESFDSAGIKDGTDVRVEDVHELESLISQIFTTLQVRPAVAQRCHFEIYDEEFEEW
jgi:hypothetical protein